MDDGSAEMRSPKSYAATPYGATARRGPSAHGGRRRRQAVLYWHTLSSRPLEPLLADAPQTLPAELVALLPREN
jgi:hypothetical protein